MEKNKDKTFEKSVWINAVYVDKTSFADIFVHRFYTSTVSM